MPTQKNHISKFNQCMKSDKRPCTIYEDLESLIEKIDNCKNNPKKSSTTKIGEHIADVYSISTVWAFDNIENRHSLYRGEDCMKSFVFL